MQKISTKIVHLTSVHKPFDIRIYYKECRSLAKKGYEVVLIAPHEREEESGSVKIVPVSMGRGRVRRILITVPCVLFKALRERANVYHYHDPELMVIGIILSLLGKKVIYDMHENVPKDILTKGWIPKMFRNPLSRMFTVIQRILLSGTSVVFAEHSYVKDYEWVRNKIVVLNTPIVEMLDVVEMPAQKDRSVAYIGGVCCERGSVSTLKALSMLKDDGVEVGFECVGSLSPEHGKELSGYINTFNLRRISIHGYLRPEVAWERAARCMAGLAILDAIPNYRESYATKMFEYMALELPIIVSDFPIYRAIVDEENCGMYINPGSIEELAQCIRWIVDNPVKAREMGRNGRRAVLEKYNWHMDSDKLMGFYNQMKHS